jgi:ATP-binding cassette subfamily F protein 3
MLILTLQHIAKSFGSDTVLRDVSLALNQGERLGLVGVNGSGKTTLLRILSGETRQDEGQISISKNLKIGYLSQVFQPGAGRTVLEEAEEALSDINAMEDKLHALEHWMGEEKDKERLTELLNDYAKATERFELAGGYEAKSQLTGVLTGLGFNDAQLMQQTDTLSGGELTRLGLAKLLLQKPDLLLLDEPTNHLDMETLSWLESYLVSYSGSIIVVSHDRYFLDAVCTGMAELLFGELEVYRGNYTSYVRQRDERFASRTKAFQLQQREIFRQRAIIARFRSFNREKSIRAAESREKALARVELLDRPDEERRIAFRFEARKLLGDIAFRAKGLKKSYGQRVLFQGVNLLLRGGDHAALIGPNGIGKTTLLSCILGREPLDEGSFEFAPKASIGYYDQRQLNLDPDKDVLNEVWDSFPLINQTQIRGALGLFLFSGDDVFTPVRLLSGGERSRVSLTKLMLRKDNFLLLDEPTNHLDADSREALEKALEGYEGTILAISHDRYFINRFANRVLVMTTDGISSYEGNYDEYLSEISRLNTEAALPENELSKTEQVKLRKAAKVLEDRASTLTAAVIQAERDAHQAQYRLDEAVNRQADREIYAEPERALAQARICHQLREQAGAAFSAWEEADSKLREFLSQNAVK